MLDDSVFSSIINSFSYEIPWLCIDGMFSHYQAELRFNLVNAEHFFTELAKELSIENKLDGILLYTTSGIPYPLTYEDIHKLSTSDEFFSQIVLAEALVMNLKAFSVINSV